MATVVVVAVCVWGREGGGGGVCGGGGADTVERKSVCSFMRTRAAN